MARENAARPDRDLDWKDKDRLWTNVESRNYFPLILSLGT